MVSFFCEIVEITAAKQQVETERDKLKKELMALKKEVHIPHSEKIGKWCYVAQIEASGKYFFQPELGQMGKYIIKEYIYFIYVKIKA